MSSKTSQNTIHNEADNYWQRSNLVKRDFWLIPIYLIATNILVLLLVYLVTQFNVDFIELEHPIYIISSILSSVILLYIFYLMHRKHQIINIALQRFRQLKPYTMLFVSTYIASTILIYIYEWLTTFLPESLQYSETQNQMEMLSLFDNPWLLPLLFIDIVILTPFVEEMLFRHLLIHELGKKFTYTLMTIISIVVFGCLHMTGAQSPFEIGSYLILGGSIVFVYLITGKNLAAAVTFHMLNNLVAFILIVVTL